MAAKLLLLAAAATALKCRAGDFDTAECILAEDPEDSVHVAACYLRVDPVTNATRGYGCMPTSFGGPFFEAAGEDCSKENGLCWCTTDECNTDSWARELLSRTEIADKCYFGVIGHHQDRCRETELFYANEHASVQCEQREWSPYCHENHASRPSGVCHQYRTREACEHVTGHFEPNSTIDGTGRACRWLQANLTTSAQFKEACEYDGRCVHAPATEQDANCVPSESQSAKEAQWAEMRGTPCANRIPEGCRKNDGNFTYDPTFCSPISDPTECKDTCVWVERGTELVRGQQCYTSGQGTLSGMCWFSDDGAPMDPHWLDRHFRLPFFAPSARLPPEGRCALITGFTDEVAQVVAGPDVAGLVREACRFGSEAWSTAEENPGMPYMQIAGLCRRLLDGLPTDETESYLELFNHLEQVGVQIGGAFLGNINVEGVGTCALVHVREGEGTAGVRSVICVCEGHACNGPRAARALHTEDGVIGMMRFIDGTLTPAADAVNAAAGVPVLDGNGVVIRENVAGLAIHDAERIAAASTAASGRQWWQLIQTLQTNSTAGWVPFVLPSTQPPRTTTPNGSAVDEPDFISSASLGVGAGALIFALS